MAQIIQTWGLEPELAAPCYRYAYIGLDDEVVGLVTMFSIHPYKQIGMVVEHFRWKPGLSPRKRLEGLATALDELGKHTQCIGYSRRHDYKFFNKAKELGLVRKVGKQSTGFGEMVTAWETPLSRLTS